MDPAAGGYYVVLEPAAGKPEHYAYYQQDAHDVNEQVGRCANHLSQIYKFDSPGEAGAFIARCKLDRTLIDTVKHIYYRSQKPISHDPDMDENIRIACDAHPSSGAQEERVWTGLMDALQNTVSRWHFGTHDGVHRVLPDLRLLYGRTDSTKTKDDLLNFVRNEDCNPDHGLFQQCWTGAATPTIEGDTNLVAIRDALMAIAAICPNNKPHYERMVTCAALYVFRFRMNAHGTLPSRPDVMQPPDGQQRPWLDVSTPSSYGFIRNNNPKSFVKFKHG
jgi:hypothetical protein